MGSQQRNKGGEGVFSCLNPIHAPLPSDVSFLFMWAFGFVFFFFFSFFLFFFSSHET